MKIKFFVTLLASSALTGCFDSDNKKNNPKFNPEKQTAIITNVDYSQGSQIALATVAQPRTLTDGFLPKNDSDYSVKTHGEYFYHIGHFGIDTIQKYHIDSPALGYYPNDGFVLRDTGETISSNPQDIAFVNSQTAIITFLGRTVAWVVNPEAKTFEEFKIRELDLSAYAFNDDGLPDLKSVKIINNRAFISMQQVDFDKAYSKEQAYVAVFDINTWEEIDATPEDTNDTKAIALTIRNPLSMQIVDDQIYLHGMDYSTYVGGLEVINPQTLKNTVIYRDNEETGRIYALQMISPNQGYVIDYVGWKNNSFKLMNINNQGVTFTPIEGYKNTALTTLSKDGQNNIWLGLSGEAASESKQERQPGVQVFTSSGELSGDVLTTKLNPASIVFLTKD
jgi:hypothetical protein